MVRVTREKYHKKLEKFQKETVYQNLDERWENYKSRDVYKRQSILNVMYSINKLCINYMQFFVFQRFGFLFLCKVIFKITKQYRSLHGHSPPCVFLCVRVPIYLCLHIILIIYLCPNDKKCIYIFLCL